MPTDTQQGMILDEDINDDFDGPINEYGCHGCKKYGYSCELKFGDEGCVYIEYNWKNVNPPDTLPLLEEFLLYYNYNDRINTGSCNKVTIFLDELESFGERLLFEIMEHELDPLEPLFRIFNIAKTQAMENTLTFENRLIQEYRVLADMFWNRPREMIGCTKQIIEHFKEEEYLQKEIGVILKGSNDNVLMHNLSQKYIEKLVCFTASLKKRTPIESYDQVSAFRCMAPLPQVEGQDICGKITNIIQDDEKTKTEPSYCKFHESQKLNKWQHVPERSVRGNIQYLKLQQINYEKEPRTVIVRAKDHSIEKVEVGDIIQVTGIWTGFLKDRRGEYESYLLCTGIEKIEYVRDITEITPEKREELLAKVSDKDYFKNIRECFAPHVDGYPDLKLALFLQQINSNDIIKIGGIPNRGTIHVLCIGNPGTSKSDLANYVMMVAPRCGKISGKGATTPGLTITANQTDKEFGKSGWSLEGGALVMHDNGTLIIDEQHEMDKSVQDSLCDPMEDMKCSGAKAGIEGTFNARVCILSCANPKYGHFKPEEQSNLAEQFNISPPLFSRYDYIQLTHSDFTNDDKTDRIMNLMLDNTGTNTGDSHLALTRDDFRDIISLSRRTNITLSNEIKETLKDFMKGMLKRIQLQIIKAENDGIEKPRFTFRLLNSLRRFAMASARARLAYEVTPHDCDIAYEILLSWIDPLYKTETGYDFSKYESPVERRVYLYDDVLKYLDNLTSHGKHPFSKEEIIYYAKHQGSNYQEFCEKFLDIAINNGQVITWGKRWKLNL